MNNCSSRSLCCDSFRIIGLDISTAAVGYAILKNESVINIVDCGYIKLKGALLEDRWRMFQEFADKHITNFYDEVYIEDYAIGFSKGGSNANTITKLAHFSGMVRGSLMEQGHRVHYLNVAHARALAGVPNKIVPPFKDMKERCWHVLREKFGEKVPLWYTRTGRVRPETYDASDALIIGVAAHAILYSSPKAT